MSAVLDTSVLIVSEPVAPDAIRDGWAVSAITLGELEAGVLLAADPSARAARLKRLGDVLAEAPTLLVDRAVAAAYAELRAATGRAPTNDIWIAATALAHGMVLVTRDERQAALPLVRSVLEPA